MQDKIDTVLLNVKQTSDDFNTPSVGGMNLDNCMHDTEMKPGFDSNRDGHKPPLMITNMKGSPK